MHFKPKSFVFKFVFLTSLKSTNVIFLIQQLYHAQNNFLHIFSFNLKILQQLCVWDGNRWSKGSKCNSGYNPEEAVNSLLWLLDYFLQKRVIVILPTASSALCSVAGSLFYLHRMIVILWWYLQVCVTMMFFKIRVQFMVLGSFPFWASGNTEKTILYSSLKTIARTV